MPICRPRIERWANEYIIIALDSGKKFNIEKINITKVVDNVNNTNTYEVIINSPKEISVEISALLPAKSESKDSDTSTITTFKYAEMPTLEEVAEKVKKHLPNNGYAIRRRGPFYDLNQGVYHDYAIHFSVINSSVVHARSDNGVYFYHNPTTPLTNENILNREQMQTILDKDTKYLNLLGLKPAAAEEKVVQNKEEKSEAKLPSTGEQELIGTMTLK